MRILIVGASGQIGSHLRAQLQAHGHTVAGTYQTFARPGLVKLDLADSASLEAAVDDVQPEVVILAAGWTWVDGNEDDPALSLVLNRDRPLQLCKLAAARRALFVTYSTDYVFDGKRGDYREGDPIAPLNAYGRAKAELEAGVREITPEHLILRTTTVYGPEHQGKNFVYQLVRRLKAKLPFRVPTDQVASPSYAPDVAAATIALCEGGAHHGTWHVAGPDALDRGAFAKLVCAEWGLDPNAIEYRPTAELNQKADRPLKANLNTDKLRAAGISVRGVREGLAAMRAAIEAGGYAGVEPEST